MIGVGANQVIVNPRHRRQLFETLAVGHQDRLDRAERPRQLRTMQAPHQRTRNHETAFGQFQFGESAAQAIDRPVGDGDRVGA